LGVSVSTLGKWVQQHQNDDLMSGPHEDVEKENARLRKENRLLREEREVLKNRSGRQPACARQKQLVLYFAGRAVADGLLVGWTPLKNVAHGLMRT
jgi:transposase